LVVDDSLSADLTSITDIVQAAVGFSKERGDTISSTSTVFAGLNRDDAGEPIPAVVTTEGASPYMTWGMDHGIELLAAAAFLFVLFRSLRGSRKALEQAFTHDETRAGEDQDPELVARVAVEELVHSDPEQVSAILSRWVLEQPQATASQQ
jgi:flagellar biosynthesis/type III secretory pathway M-ring protein FliF/YscJ